MFSAERNFYGFSMAENLKIGHGLVGQSFAHDCIKSVGNIQRQYRCNLHKIVCKNWWGQRIYAYSAVFHVATSCAQFLNFQPC